jgi:hypothetical protein
MKGHDRLIAHRKMGKPVAGVWICHGEDETKGWQTWDRYRGFDLYPEVQISQTEVPNLLDLTVRSRAGGSCLWLQKLCEGKASASGVC